MLSLAESPLNVDIQIYPHGFRLLTNTVNISPIDYKRQFVAVPHGLACL